MSTRSAAARYDHCVRVRWWLLALAGCGRFGFSHLPGDSSASADNASADSAPFDGFADAAPDAPRDSGLAACTRLALSDNFDDGVRAAVWTLLANNPVAVAETGGALQVTLATAGGAHYGGYDSATTY